MEYLVYKHNCEMHPTSNILFLAKTVDGLVMSFEPGDVIKLLPMSPIYAQSDHVMTVEVERMEGAWVRPVIHSTNYIDGL